SNARECQDNLFILCQLSEKLNEVNQDVDMVFVDFEKAFDRVSRSKLFNVLKSYGINGKLLNSVESLYSRSLNAVRVDGVTGK
ncbi:hypothetical protein JGG83_23155, partial [Salmonella enterica subsp. enterica serovar Derby]|nr:hypothetical protein [Salmonella enterica subsp. enterica serovar Derby]